MSAKLSWRETADCLAWELEDAHLQIHGMKEEIIFLRSIIDKYNMNQLYQAHAQAEWEYQQYLHSQQYEKDFPPMGYEKDFPPMETTPEAEVLTPDAEVVSKRSATPEAEVLTRSVTPVADVPVTPVKKFKKKSASSPPQQEKTEDQLIEEAIQQVAKMPRADDLFILGSASFFMPTSNNHSSPLKVLCNIFKGFMSGPRDLFFTLQAPTTMKKTIQGRTVQNVNIPKSASAWMTAATFWFAELGVFTQAVHEVIIATFVHITATVGNREDMDRLEYVIHTFSSDENITQFHESIPDDHPFKDLMRLWINFNVSNFVGSLETIISLFRNQRYLEAQAKLRTLSISTDITIFTCMELEKKYRGDHKTFTHHQCITLRWCKAMAAMAKTMELFSMICISCIDGMIMALRFHEGSIPMMEYEYPNITFSSLFKRQMSFIQLSGAEPFTTITTLDQALSMVATQDNHKPALSLDLHKVTKGSLFETPKI